MVKTVYEASDGKQFDEFSDAQAHEAFTHNRTALRAVLRAAWMKHIGTVDDADLFIEALVTGAVDFHQAYSGNAVIMEADDEEEYGDLPRLPKGRRR